MRSINLIMFGNHERGALHELREAARLVSARHPEINAVALTTKARVIRAAKLAVLATRPTLSIEIDKIRFPAPFRAQRLTREVNYGKLEELRRLGAVGVPVPRWVEITPGASLDAGEWGPYVVVKPTNAQRGACVMVHRTGRVRYKAPEEFEAGHPGRSAPMIAQEFIYTGKYPISHRVITYLGKPISAYRYRGRTTTALNDRFAFKGLGGAYNIVASAVGCTAETLTDPDILDLASRAHAAFPSVPYLGVDVIRDAVTGALYVLETNPSGLCWPFDTRTAAVLGSFMGHHPREQFNAIETIAEASAEAALRQAA